MSLSKFNGIQDGAGMAEKLYWHRAETDGAPYRGPNVPLLTEEEFESHLRRVSEVDAGIFDISDPEQKKQYLEILTRITNGWYECIYVDRWVGEQDHKPYVRLEWVAYYMELPIGEARQGSEVQIEPGKQRSASQNS